MTFDTHCLGGEMLVYTSEQKAWMVSIICSPPPWNASAVIAQSRPAALLVFIAAIASAVSCGWEGQCRWEDHYLAEEVALME